MLFKAFHFVHALGTNANTFNRVNGSVNVEKCPEGKYYDNLSYSCEFEEKTNLNNKPPPPIRRSSSISSQDTNANLTIINRKLKKIIISY